MRRNKKTGMISALIGIAMLLAGTTAMAAESTTETESTDSTVQSEEESSTEDELSESTEDSEDEIEVTDITVTVNDEEYYFSEDFEASDIPLGYEETSLTFNGQSRKFVVNDADVYLGYLVDEDGEAAFFLYEEEDATFVPYTAISISDSTTIVLLADVSELSVPSDYTVGSMTVGELTYPYWIDPDNEDYDILYALNTTTGAKSLYRYDPTDDTYQSWSLSDTAEEEEAADGVLAIVGTAISGYPLFFLIGAAVLVLLVILFAVKLVLRNRELDYVYDTAGIAFDRTGKLVSKAAGETAKRSEPESADEEKSTVSDADITEGQLLEYLEQLENEKK